MKFSDFESVEQVIKKYPLRVTKQQFLPNVEFIPPDWFIKELDFAIEKQTVGDSEFYYREYFIAHHVQPMATVFT